MAYNRTYYYNVVSQAKQRYRVEFYDQIAGSTYRDIEGTPGPDAVKIKWGSDGSKMFAPFKPSTLTLNFMVTDFTSANYIREIRTNRIEQDIYVAVYRENVNGAASPQYAPIWGGFLLPDLSSDPDISVPWNVTMRAVDGISALKYYDYIPSTTDQSGNNLYYKTDTWMPDGAGNGMDTWRTFKQVIADCFLYLGPFTTTQGNASDPIFRTACRWYNGEMLNATDDPLTKTRVKPDIFYKAEELTDEITKYKPMTCYDVLKAICEAWGMRLFYWRNCYYFIQLNQWRNNQSGTQLSPDDITNFRYNINASGSLIGTSESVQGWWGTYQLYIDNKPDVANSQIKWNKKAGGQYGILPAFKKVTVDFLNVDNINRFTEFPPIPLTTGIGEPQQVGTNQYLNAYEWKSLGVYTLDGINDQPFYQKIYQNVVNPSLHAFKIGVTWGMFARPAGTGSNGAHDDPVTNGYTKYLRPSPNNANGYGAVWDDMFAFQWFGWPYNNWQHATIPPGNSTIEITDDPVYGTIPQFPVLEATHFPAGDWELCYYVYSDVFWNAVATPGYPLGTIFLWDGHGEILDPGNLAANENPWHWNISMHNVQATQGIGASEFAPIINGAIGTAMTTTNLVQTGSDTANVKITNILFGDTGNNQSEGCVQIYTGTVWQASDFSGVWGLNSLSGGNSLAQQLATDVIEAQAQPIKKFTVTTLLNPERGVYWNDGTANRPQYPFPGTKWNTLSHTPSATFGKSWLMHTGEFNITEDQWKWVLYEQAEFEVISTTTTTQTGGWNTGTIGGRGNDVPSDHNHQARRSNPSDTNAQELSNLRINQQKPLAKISTASEITEWDGTGDEPPYEQTITSLSVYAMTDAIFKTGDKIIVHATSNLRLLVSDTSSTTTPTRTDKRYENNIEFEVAEDQAVDDTSISVTSKTIYQNIYAGNIISFSTRDIISQIHTNKANSNYYYQKCSGTVTTSATDGVISTIPFDTDVTKSTETNITFYGAAGPGGIEEGGEYAFSMGAGDFQIGWCVGTNTDTTNNRVLGGVKLQSGQIEAGAITWTDVEPTTSYIYDRGNGSIRKGSTSSTIMITPSIEYTEYFRLVLWKEESTTATTKLITLTNATSIFIIQQQ